MKTSTRHANERGTTLIELIVTLAIFAAVTLVVTTSYLTLFSLRGESRATQQANDELRLVFDTMEREASFGTQFHRDDCSGGVTGRCTLISFETRTRAELNPYTVTYRFKAGRIEKAVQRPDEDTGICKDLHATPSGPALDESCFFPVTSESIVLDPDSVNFGVEFANQPGDYVRPIITVIAEGHVATDAGTGAPITYSTSFSSRKTLLVNSFIPVDTVKPHLKILSITGPSCGVIVDDTTLDTNYSLDSLSYGPWDTGCDMVSIKFKAYDDQSYISKVEYLSNRLSLTTGVYPKGTRGGATPETDWFLDIPLKKGILNDITVTAYDISGNPLAAIIHINQTDPAEKPDATLLSAYATLQCISVTSMTSASSIGKPPHPSLYNIIWNRCTGLGCVPTPGIGGHEVYLHWDNRWDPIVDSNLYGWEREGGFVASAAGEWIHDRSDPIDQTVWVDVPVDYNIFYRYDVTVIDPDTLVKSDPVPIKYRYWSGGAGVSCGDGTNSPYGCRLTDYCVGGYTPPPLPGPVPGPLPGPSPAFNDFSLPGSMSATVTGATTGVVSSSPVITSFTGTASSVTLSFVSITGPSSIPGSSPLFLPTILNNGATGMLRIVNIQNSTPTGNYSVRIRATDTSSGTIIERTVPLVIDLSDSGPA